MRPVAGLLIFVFLLSGCVTSVPILPPVADPEAAWQQHKARLTPVTDWKLQGRMALRAADQGWHVQLNWDRSGDHHRLDLTGPLGRGHMRLLQDERGAELLDNEKHVWRAPSAEAVLFEATGWRLPLKGLNYWIVGLADPSPVTERQLDTQGRLKRLIQSGWDIQFLEYTRFGTFDVPSKLYVTRLNPGEPKPATDEEMLEVRLSIERWTIK